jgi:protein Tex
MQLEGVVTNLVAFGAFVDIGVHQDGLVHVSQLADRFVRDPAEVVKVGQKVNVTVLSVDLERNRIALSMRRQSLVEARRDERPRTAPTPTKREDKPRVPPKGSVAPNGMRFR